MSASPGGLVVPPRAAGWTTPQKLQACLALCLGGAVILFAGVESEVSVAQGVVKTIGQDSAPSILAAEEVSAELAGLDASAAADLLAAGASPAAEREAFEKWREAAARSLVSAAESTSTRDSDRASVQVLIDQLGAYLELIGEARVLRQTGDSAGAVKIYFDATSLLHRRLLAAAHELDSAHQAVLDHAYSIEWSAEARATWFEALVLAVLITLGGAQLFVAQQSRRLINPSLVGATLIALAFLEMMGRSLDLQAGLLKVANEDAFAAVRGLLRVRAELYDAQGDDSRFLLDPHGEHGLPDHLGMRALLERGLKYAAVPPAEPAPEAIEQGLERYLVLEQEVRSEERFGKHARAAEISAGSEEGEGAYELEHLDRELGAVIEADQAAFERNMEQAQRELDGYRYYAPIAALAVAVLSWLGLRARQREYDL